MIVRICGTRWKVLERTESELEKICGKKVEGACIPHLETIYINSELPEHRKAVAFTHEAIHAVCDYIGLMQKSEWIAESLGPALYDLISDFPEKYRRS